MARSKTIIGIPTMVKDRGQIDTVIHCIKHNLKGLNKNNFAVVVDINGVSDELRNYFELKIQPLKSQIDIAIIAHAEAGRTDAMNRISRYALDRSDAKGIIYLNDDIMLDKGALLQLSLKLDNHTLVGGLVLPLDTGGKKDTTLAQQAQLDFESRVRKKLPQLHGAFFGISKSGLEELARDGFFPPIHFEDAWLTIRYKLQHGLDKEVPIVTDARAFMDMPATWSSAVKKVARYSAGQKQLIEYFEHQGRQDVATAFANLSNSFSKATVQFRSAWKKAEETHMNTVQNQDSPDVTYITDLWQELADAQVKPAFPSAPQMRDMLNKFITWNSREETYTLREPEVSLPLLNSIINLLGTYQAESRQQRVDQTWERDPQLTRGPKSLAPSYACGTVCQLSSAVSVNNKSIGISP